MLARFQPRAGRVGSKAFATKRKAEEWLKVQTVDVKTVLDVYGHLFEGMDEAAPGSSTSEARREIAHQARTKSCGRYWEVRKTQQP